MSERTLMYTHYERTWHWLQAVVIILLILTGVEIHAPDAFHLTGFETAVTLHRTLGFLLIANAAIGFLYQLLSGQIRQYFSSSQDFLPLAVRQGSYLLRGVFHGEPHPFEKSREKRLNPLQRVVYVATLNFLLPIQAVTGLLLWGAQRWPETVVSAGGIAVLAAVHTAGSWIFVAFVIAHLYLITVGRTPTANLRAMLTGYEMKDSSE
jgi:thiosulfate reductase cytochrome b subunit